MSIGTAVKRRKYRNIPTTVDGIRFDSRIEANRYGQLKILQRAGTITELECDKKKLRYPLIVNGVKVGSYVADFRYRERGRLVVEDVKGMKTPVYRLKKKLMLALYGIEIREITK